MAKQVEITAYAGINFFDEVIPFFEAGADRLCVGQGSVTISSLTL